MTFLLKSQPVNAAPNARWRKVKEFDSPNAARIEMTIREMLRDGRDYTITDDMGDSCVFYPREDVSSSLLKPLPYWVAVSGERVASFDNLRRADAYVCHLFYEGGEGEPEDFTIAISYGVLIRYRKGQNGLEHYWANGNELPRKVFESVAQ